MRFKVDLVFSIIILVILGGLVTSTYFVLQELIFQNWENEETLVMPIKGALSQTDLVKRQADEAVNEKALTYQLAGYDLKFEGLSMNDCPVSSGTAVLTDCYYLNYTFKSCQSDCYPGSCVTNNESNPKGPCLEPIVYEIKVTAAKDQVLSMVTNNVFDELRGEFINATSSNASSSDQNYGQ